MTKRIISALILTTILFSVLLLGNRYAFFLMAEIFIGFGLHEFFSMFEKGKKPCFKILGIIIGLLLPPIMLLKPDFIVLYIGFAIILTYVISLTLKKESVKNTVIGIFYVSFLGSHMILLRDLNKGQFLILLVFLIVSMGDTMALYIGKLIGKTPLAPKISPKKTREGSCGGILGSIIGILIAKFLFFPELTLIFCIIVGSLGSILGQSGDLIESFIKRKMGVKDSGTIIPGHGGVLDRIDSALFTSPFMYYYIILFGI